MENKRLDYKPSVVAVAEEKHEKSLFDEIDKMMHKPSVITMMFLYEAGGGDPKDVDALIEKSDDGYEYVSALILQGLKRSGFLGEKKDLKVEEIIAKGREAMAEFAAELSRNGGEAKSNSPTK